MRRPSNHALRVAGLSLLALVLVAFFVRFLQGFSYLPGTDSYYYVLQAQSLLDAGHLKVPDHGILYYVVAALARLGLSIEVAFRFTLTAIVALYQAGMLRLVLGLEEKAQSLAALLWGLGSPVVAFHAIEFPNLTLGLATIPIWFWLGKRPIRRSMLWLAALLCASAAAHPVAGAIAVLFLASVSLASVAPRAKRSPGMAVLVIAAGGTIPLIALAVLNPGVASRVLPFGRGWPGLVGLAASAGIPNELKLTVLSFWLLLAILLIFCRRIFPGPWKFLAAATLLLPLCPDQFVGLDGLGGRLSALFPLLALPLIVFTCNELAGRWMRFSWLNSVQAARFIALAVVLAVALMPVRVEAYSKLLMVDDYATYEKVVDALRDTKVSMLIAHRGLDFFYSYRLGRDAFHFDPEAEWNSREIWRVAVRIAPEEVAYYSPPECPWGETAKLIRGTNYLLVREDCWEQLRARLSRSDNPDLYTEVWENMENPSQKRPAFMRARYRAFDSGPFSRP